MKPHGLPRTLILAALALAASGVLITAAGALATHAYGAQRLRRARAAFDARWGQLVPEAPRAATADENNGARWLEGGGRAIEVTLEDQNFYSQLMTTTAARWSSDERARAMNILDEQRDALAMLLRTATCSDFELLSGASSVAVDETDYLAIVKGLRLLALEARLAWVEGRRNDSLAALAALGRAGDGLLRTPTVLALTFGSAADRWTTLAATDLVEDPCTGVEALVALREILPSEDPIHRANVTLTTSVTEIADEGLQYIEDIHDPSVGWSIPFWVSNHYLLEDLVVATAVEGWSRYLEIGQIPAARWSTDGGRAAWAVPDWPPWMAMAGTLTPNLLTTWVRVQAASTQLQLLELVIELRLTSPASIDATACTLIAADRPTALTGEPIGCRYDEQLQAIVIEAVGADRALGLHLEAGSLAASLPAVVLPVGSAGGDCP